jgi:hypothetical protein
VFGNEDSLVKRIRFAVITDKTPWIEIVDVVGHIRSVSLETDLLPQVYWPKAQLRQETHRSQERGTLVVRTFGRPELFTSAVVEQIWIWGAGVGLVLAWMAGRALKTQLYGVGSADAGALAFAPASLLATALLAGLGPARNAIVAHCMPAARQCYLRFAFDRFSRHVVSPNI